MYNLSDNRIVKIESEKLTVIIEDVKARKSIVIPAVRWHTFVIQFDEIENAINQLRERQYVKYFQHIGGGWYVSITTGYYCIDIRRFYKKDEEIKPTREGFTLKVSEWPTLKAIAEKLPIDVPALAAVQPCYYALDHQNLLGYLDCQECSPFGMCDSTIG
jgi:hypothetical protein